MITESQTQSQEESIITYLNKNGRTSLSSLNIHFEFNTKHILNILMKKKRILYISEYRIQDCGYELSYLYIPLLTEGTLCALIYNLIKEGTNRRNDIIKQLSYKYQESSIKGRISELNKSGLIVTTKTYKKNREYKIHGT